MSGAADKLFVFLAFANDRGETRDGYLRELPPEEKRIRAALEATDWCELVVRSNVSLHEVFDVFQDPRYRHRIAVFHYGGHANSYQLLLESEGGATQPIRMEGLAAFLGKQRGLQLVFLNGCSTGPQARDLVQAGVPAVIATSRAIKDGVARAFAARFYAGLARGHSIEDAYQAASKEGEAGLGSSERAYRELGVPGVEGDRWPWHLVPEGEGIEVHQWSLPEATGDPTAALPPVPRGDDLPRAPFINLHRFERGDAEIFFGRGQEIRELYDHVTDLDGAPIILLYGQSGVGKSSLLDAGLRPRLEHTHEIRYARRDQAAGLLGTLERALDGHDGTVHTAWHALEATLGRPVVVILDQLEEVFTRPNAAQPDELGRLLAGLDAAFGERGTRPAGRLILSFRKEWLAEVLRDVDACALPHTTVLLEALDRRGIIEAITGPARSDRLRKHYRLSIEPGLAGLIADDLLEDRDAPVAPTLQVLLARMWDEAKRDDHSQPRFTSELYHGLKRDGILLGDFLDQQLEDIREWRAAAADSGLVLDVLAFHTTPLGTAEQRSAAELSGTYPQHDDLPALMQKAKDLYLLTDPAGDRPGLTATRLAHDTLAPLVRRRFDESDKPGQRARRILESRAVDWQGERPGTPLDGHDLAEVERGADGMRARTPAESRLVDASLRKRTGRRRSLGTAAAFVFMLAVGLLFTANEALQQRGAAQAEREHADLQTRIASARQLVSQAESIVNRGALDLDRALLLAIEAAHGFREAGLHSLEVDQVLRHAMAIVPPHRHRLWHESPVNALMFTPAGHLLVTTALDDFVAVWDVDSGEEVTRLGLDDGDTVRTSTLSHDARYLVTGSERGAVTVWDLEHATALTPYRHDAPVQVIALSSDRELLATGSGHAVQVWALHPPRRIDELPHPSAVTSIDFSDDGSHIITGSTQDAIARVWEVGSPRPPTELPHGAALHAVAFIDSHHVVTLDALGQVTVWDTAAAGNTPRLLEDTDDPIKTLAFSRDRRYLATAGANEIARIWEWRAHAYQPVARLAHDGGIVALSFSADGHRIVTASVGRTGRIWDTATGEEVVRLPHAHEVVAVSLSSDAAYAATSSANGFARIWEVPERGPVGRDGDTGGGFATLWHDGVYAIGVDADHDLRVWNADERHLVACCVVHEHSVEAVSVSRDESLIATLSAGDIRLWNWRAREEAVARPVDFPSAIALSPDGGQLVVGDNDGAVRVWDVTPSLELVEPAIVADDPGLHDAKIVAITYSADGRYLLAASRDVGFAGWPSVATDIGPDVSDAESFDWFDDDLRVVEEPGRVVVWEVEDWQSTLHIEHGGLIEAARFSPDGSYVATAGADDRIQLWNVDDQRMVGALTHAQVEDLAFSPSGRLLASWGRQDVRVWEVASNRRVNQGAILHEGEIRDIAFSGDERYLAAAGQAAVHMWHVDSGAEIVRIDTHSPVARVRFDEDDASLITVGEDGTLQRALWRPDDLVAEGCARLGRNLTWTEWEQYRVSDPYRATCAALPLMPSEVFDRAMEHHRAGHAELASRAVEDAVALVRETDYAAIGNRICWTGSIEGYAQLVAPACDHAVALRPDNGDYRDSRGVARVVTGDYEGAIEDFEFYVESAQHLGRVRRNLDMRRDWIERLGRQEYPFDDDTFNALRAEGP